MRYFLGVTSFTVSLLWLSLIPLGVALGQGVELPKTVTLQVGFPAGGPADTAARLIGERLGEVTGSNFVILNRPGAGATLAAGAVAQAEPDGANLLLVSSGHAGAAALYPNLKFDTIRSFAPIVLLAQSPVIVLVSKASPHKSLADLVHAAKSKPGTLTYGTSGGATLPALAAALLRRQIGYDALAVAYRGSGPANIDLLAGVLDFNYDTVSGAVGLLASGDLRGLAVTSRNRIAAAPDVPTVAESINIAFDVTGWFGLLGPARMPEALVARLNGETNAILKDARFRAKLTMLGMEAMGGTRAEFAALRASETEQWGAVIRDLGLNSQ
jgi:tripartite-type tricarboxylate transporter receptor subunit TctC